MLTTLKPLDKRVVIVAALTTALLSLSVGCASVGDRATNSPQSWSEITSALQTFTRETTYDEIVQSLGKPYREFVTPSAREEYVLYFNVPGEPDSMHWVMLDTETKHFWYAGNEKQPRPRE